MHFNEAELWELPWKWRRHGPFPPHILRTGSARMKMGWRGGLLKFHAWIYPKTLPVWLCPLAQQNAYWRNVWIMVHLTLTSVVHFFFLQIEPAPAPVCCLCFPFLMHLCLCSTGKLVISGNLNEQISQRQREAALLSASTKGRHTSGDRLSTVLARSCAAVSYGVAHRCLSFSPLCSLVTVVSRCTGKDREFVLPGEFWVVFN